MRKLALSFVALSLLVGPAFVGNAIVGDTARAQEIGVGVGGVGVRVGNDWGYRDRYWRDRDPDVVVIKKKRHWRDYDRYYYDD